jgi:hypothetical protein
MTGRQALTSDETAAFEVLLLSEELVLAVLRHHPRWLPDSDALLLLPCSHHLEDLQCLKNSSMNTDGRTSFFLKGIGRTSIHHLRT